MNCMKCGREVNEGHVFCDECFATMEHEPIKIDAPVLIPAQPPKKAAPRRPVFNPEEEVKWLEKLNRNLCLVLVLLAVTVLLLLIYVFNREFLDAVEELGRNYHVLETVTTPIP